MLSVESIAKRFCDTAGNLQVLSNVSLTVPAKSVTGVVGPTGCGKTTILRIIAGLERPSSGRVVFDEERLNNHSPISIVFQQPTLLPWRDVYENVRLPLEIARGRVQRSEPEVDSVIDAVGLNGFTHYRPSRMSGGMQARTALARALVQRPELLLLDEPLASVDELTRSGMYALIVDLFRKYGTSAVWVTHSILEASILSDVVVVLSDRPATVVGAVEISMPKEERLTDPDHPQLVLARTQIRRFLEMGWRRAVRVVEEKV
jgi:NitT/TauT family transport system ATP-binding protein